MDVVDILDRRPEVYRKPNILLGMRKQLGCGRAASV